MKKVIMLCLLSFFFLYGSAFGAFNFIDNGNGTVTDARTGLVWLKNADSFPNGHSWADASTCCSSLKNGDRGLTDGSTAGQWRLPSKEELEGIGTDPPATWEYMYPSVPWTMPGAPFTNVYGFFWSSTEYAGSPDRALVVGMYNGLVVADLKIYDTYSVWPVREPFIDTDGDGVSDNIDNCPTTPNGPLLGTCSSTSDKPGINCTSDADCVIGCSSNGLCIKDQRDTDSDSHGDVCDNCPTIANPSQLNNDNDSLGNACDDDDDNDGIPDGDDNCPNVSNPDQADTNQNGLGDECDC